jgi:hypothetical protein
MFKKLRTAYAELLAALNRWRDAINKHADDLEADEPAKVPTEANGRHTEERPARARR